MRSVCVCVGLFFTVTETAVTINYFSESQKAVTPWNKLELHPTPCSGAQRQVWAHFFYYYCICLLVHLYSYMFAYAHVLYMHMYTH